MYPASQHASFMLRNELNFHFYHLLARYCPSMPAQKKWKSSPKRCRGRINAAPTLFREVRDQLIALHLNLLAFDIHTLGQHILDYDEIVSKLILFDQNGIAST